jgi:hypothetical protein
LKHPTRDRRSSDPTLDGSADDRFLLFASGQGKELGEVATGRSTRPWLAANYWSTVLGRWARERRYGRTAPAPLVSYHRSLVHRHHIS